MGTTATALRTPAAPQASPDHGFGGTPAETLRLAIAPSTGRLQAAVAVGDVVRAGDVLAFVTGSRGRADAVVAPADGLVRGLLARPGQLVGTGRALVWLDAGTAPARDATRAAA